MNTLRTIVLIVEDAAEIQTAIMDAVRTLFANYDSIGCETVTEALEIIGRVGAEIKLVITDGKLEDSDINAVPYLHGEMVVAAAQSAKVPNVIYYSAGGPSEYTADTTTEYIEKPDGPVDNHDELLAKLTELAKHYSSFAS